MKQSILQFRKIGLIEYLLGIKDERTFDKIESFIQKKLKSIKTVDIVFSMNELVQSAEFSNNQIKKDMSYLKKN
jgi:hypothetical protein